MDHLRASSGQMDLKASETTHHRADSIPFCSVIVAEATPRLIHGARVPRTTQKRRSLSSDREHIFHLRPRLALEKVRPTYRSRTISRARVNLPYRTSTGKAPDADAGGIVIIPQTRAIRAGPLRSSPCPSFRCCISGSRDWPACAGVRTSG